MPAGRIALTIDLRFERIPERLITPSGMEDTSVPILYKPICNISASVTAISLERALPSVGISAYPPL